MTKRHRKAVNVIWLVIALLLHSALLLVPVNTPDESSPVTKSLTVALVKPLKTEPPLQQPPDIQPESIPENKPASTALEPEITPLENPLLLSTKPLSKTVTTAHLVQSVSRLKLPTPEKGNVRELGVFSAPSLPSNWSPNTKIEENLFDGRMATASTEILDQWSDANGNQNMMIKTSSGQTLCGTTQPWNPMNPLQEHVTMWRRCPSGRKRTTKNLP